jgi:PRTRC genetic system protein A
VCSSDLHVKTILPILAEGEHMVLDIHSHGRFPAGFSPVDDKDDRGENKVAFVVGNLDKETVTMDSRLCLEGLFLSLPPPFHIGGQT